MSLFLRLKIRNIANHQNRQAINHQEQRQVAARRPFDADIDNIGSPRGDHLRRGGNRQTDEMILRRSLGLDIEARQPQRAADDVE